MKKFLLKKREQMIKIEKIRRKKLNDGIQKQNCIYQMVICLARLDSTRLNSNGKWKIRRKIKLFECSCLKLIFPYY
jgi:hypothetical protein